MRSWRKSSHPRFCSSACRGLNQWGPRKTAECPICHGIFLPRREYIRTCSRACGAQAMHANRPVTTGDVYGLSGTDKEHYRRDEHGQWWYQSKEKYRTRAVIRICQHCKLPFLSNVFHKQQICCSRTCGARESVKLYPNSYCGSKPGGTNSGGLKPGTYTGEESPKWKGGSRLSQHHRERK